MTTIIATGNEVLLPRGGSRLPAGLIRAYLEAHYQVSAWPAGRGRPVIPFRIGNTCLTLTQLLWRLGVAEAAFITACNPDGQPLGRFANRRLLTELQRHVQERHLSWLPGLGSGDDWPAEPSLLLPGVGRSVGDAIAGRFRQCGWVLLDRRHTPRLVLLQ